MNILFLRGSVPTDRNPRQIMFDTLEECDDVWTRLAHALSCDGYGEVWYWGGNRKVKYRDNFIERWVPDYKKQKCKFVPDVIFARGGFPQYDVIFSRHPDAFKIYYGAGHRHVPSSNFKDYDLILVDTEDQRKQVMSALPKNNCQLFIKPAADNIFYPEPAPKKYDVIFSSNEHKKGIKGHGFILPIFPHDLSIIQVGIASKALRARHPRVQFTGWVPRKKIKELYGQSKIAIVCCTSRDSCPRIIPEALACNCPLLVLDTVNFWRKKYINEQTGRIASQENFIAVLREMISSYETFTPYEYYKDNLSLTAAANYIKGLIG